MGNLGWSEMFFIVVFALIIFGPRKLPEMAKKLGRTMAQLRRMSEEFKQTWEAEIERADLKELNQEIQQATEISEEQLASEQAATDLISPPILLNPVSESVAKLPMTQTATEQGAIDSKPISQMKSEDEHPISIA